MYASNSQSYTHLILALVIVREPTVWVLITSKYPGTHDIGLPANTISSPAHAHPAALVRPADQVTLLLDPAVTCVGDQRTMQAPPIRIAVAEFQPHTHCPITVSKQKPNTEHDNGGHNRDCLMVGHM